MSPHSSKMNHSMMTTPHGAVTLTAKAETSRSRTQKGQSVHKMKNSLGTLARAPDSSAEAEASRFRTRKGSSKIANNSLGTLPRGRALIVVKTTSWVKTCKGSPQMVNNSLGTLRRASTPFVKTKSQTFQGSKTKHFIMMLLLAFTQVTSAMEGGAELPSAETLESTSTLESPDSEVQGDISTGDSATTLLKFIDGVMQECRVFDAVEANCRDKRRSRPRKSRASSKKARSSRASRKTSTASVRRTPGTGASRSIKRRDVVPTNGIAGVGAPYSFKTIPPGNEYSAPKW